MTYVRRAVNCRSQWEFDQSACPFYQLLFRAAIVIFLRKQLSGQPILPLILRYQKLYLLVQPYSASF